MAGSLLASAAKVAAADLTKVENLMEEYARQVLHTEIDATDCERGSLAGAVLFPCYYFLAGAIGTWKADGATASGLDGNIGLIAGAGVTTWDPSAPVAAAGLMGIYRFPTSEAMPTSAEGANALFDQVFGAEARYGLSFRWVGSSRRGLWLITTKATVEVDFENPDLAGVQAFGASLMVYRDPDDQSKAIVLHLSGVGTAAAYIVP